MSVTNGDVLKCFLELVLEDGSIVQNVYHFIADFAADHGDSTVGAAVESYIEDIMGALATYLDDGFTINPSYLHKVAFNPTLSKWEVTALVDVFTPSFTHSAAGDALPNQIAAVLTANTLRPKSKGRKFIPGLAESASQGSDLVAGMITAMGTALNHYLADETVVDTDVLSPGVPREGVDSFLEFADGVVNSVVGTQRRRKPGVGG